MDQQSQNVSSAGAQALNEPGNGSAPALPSDGPSSARPSSDVTESIDRDPSDMAQGTRVAQQDDAPQRQPPQRQPPQRQPPAQGRLEPGGRPADEHPHRAQPPEPTDAEARPETVRPPPPPPPPPPYLARECSGADEQGCVAGPAAGGGDGRLETARPYPLTHPNGASMFPSMSTSEQEDMAREALTQAEASIVAESSDDGGDEAAARDDESDGGYSSDGFSSGSTSAQSSVRDYLFENGRRYHRFREGAYNFPDDVEQEREDMKHAMVKLLCSQKLHLAPIGDHPQEMLDIGTGTGIWAIEMGDQFPSAHVLGIDLSPIQPDWLPPNVRFLVDDVESPWLYQRNHFDYIHSRHTVMAIRDWARLFRRAHEHLKSGGWIELQEIHHKPRSAHADGAVPAEHVVAQFWERVNEGLTALGIDLDTASGGLLARMMGEAGFASVTERVFHVPIGTWPKNKVLKTVGLYWRTILLDGLQAIALGPLTRGLRWNREQVELFLMEVRRAYHDNAALMYMPLHIIYAQKPA